MNNKFNKYENIYEKKKYIYIYIYIYIYMCPTKEFIASQRNSLAYKGIQRRSKEFDFTKYKTELEILIVFRKNQ